MILAAGFCRYYDTNLPPNNSARKIRSPPRSCSNAGDGPAATKWRTTLGYPRRSYRRRHRRRRPCNPVQTWHLYPCPVSCGAGILRDRSEIIQELESFDLGMDSWNSDAERLPATGNPSLRPPVSVREWDRWVRLYAAGYVAVTRERSWTFYDTPDTDAVLSSVASPCARPYASSDCPWWWTPYRRSYIWTDVRRCESGSASAARSCRTTLDDRSRTDSDPTVYVRYCPLTVAVYLSPTSSSLQSGSPTSCRCFPDAVVNWCRWPDPWPGPLMV